MIFTRSSLVKITAGTKTETRRIWKAPHARVGGVYRTRSARFGPSEPGDPTIRVTAMRRETLGEITSEAARREGCATLSEFVKLWVQLHGEWYPGAKVYVITFEVVK